ncbi:MAG TPA: choice-of-anchor Q domain-containing protein [Actinomycetota bacterium]|nr:choice-of-anchor Q domain-containing protein [Actinomycetota bacterium]
MVRRIALVIACIAGALVAMPSSVTLAAPTIRIDTPTDSFDGSCADGDCALRDGVTSAPAGARIVLPPGFYPLTRGGTGGVGHGSIELRRAVELVSVGETGAFIDATGLGAPAFTVAPRRDPRARVTLAGLTLFGARTPSLTGAGIDVRGGVVHLVEVTVAGGVADRGGAIAIAAPARLRLTDSLLLGNQAAAGGGVWTDGALFVSGSAIASNRASGGGGIWSGPGSTTVLGDTTVAENTAGGEGGGLRLAGRAELVATTVGANRAAIGGGVFVAPGASVEADRSIVAGNRAGRARQCRGAMQSRGDNLDQGHRCGFDSATDLRDTDARLLRPAPNGGPTPTMALSARSPAVDLAGDCEERDQRGAPRDRRCDAGAYELVRCLGLVVNIVGTTRHDELSGGRGPDAFLGLGGDDEFQGSIGDDRACGGPGDDLLIAGPGEDRFGGEAGDDRVKGESGDDRLDGGPGRDRLAGGPGRDRCEADVRDRRSSGCELAT